MRQLRLQKVQPENKSGGEDTEADQILNPLASDNPLRVWAPSRAILIFPVPWRLY
jgi:hypothetical protein